MGRWKKSIPNVMRGDPFCLYCLEYRSTTVDHIIPRYLGGPNGQHNLAGCCFECNKNKGHLTVFQAGMTLHPSLRLIEICESIGLDAYDYNKPYVPVPEVEREVIASYGGYDLSLGARLSDLDWSK